MFSISPGLLLNVLAKGIVMTCLGNLAPTIRKQMIAEVIHNPTQPIFQAIRIELGSSSGYLSALITDPAFWGFHVYV